MYLRTTKRKNKDGSVVEYYQLAHNERHPVTRKPVAKIVHSFGRADQLDRDELVRLCRSIARVCGLAVVDPFEETHEESLKKSAGLPADMKIIRTLFMGSVMVIEKYWELLGMKKTVESAVGKNKLGAPYERALLAMVANRLCRPESKLGVWDRWLSEVYLPSCDGIKLDQMYEAMDLLHENHEDIEWNVFNHTVNLFNFDVDVIFYDTTTASFCIDREDEDEDGEDTDENGKDEDGKGKALRKFGHAKEGTWSPQAVVALAVTNEGIPVRCRVFPGNTSDVDTVERVRRDLRGWQLGRAMFVADSGMNSKENRAELARACGKYLPACRMSSVSEIKREVLSKKGRYTVFKDNLQAKEVTVGEGVRRTRYILCYNPKEAKRQKNHRDEVVQRLEKELGKHKDKSSSAQWAVELLASKRFKRYLSVTKTGKLRIDRTKIREAGRYDGKWVIETNDDTISLRDASNGYKSLMVIERCFRSLKRTQIKMTPMYHWAPRRIETHVRICVLALMIERIAEIKCGLPWPAINRSLEKLQATEIRSGDYRFTVRNEIPADTRDILEKLAVPVPKQIISVAK